MKRYLGWILSLIFLVAVTSMACAVSLHLSKDQWQEDIKFLHQKLINEDPGVDRNISKPELEKEFQRLLVDVNQLDGFQIQLRLKEILARIGDPHTNFTPKLTRVYPVTFQWLDDGLFVTKATQPYQDLIGKKLISINGVSTTKLLAAFRGIIPTMNDYWLLPMSLPYFRSFETLKYFKIVPKNEEAELTLADRNGEEKHFTVRPLTPDEKATWVNYDVYFKISLPISQNSMARSKYYYYEYWPEHQTVYFQYNSCKEMKDVPFANFCTEMFTLAKKENAQYLIIDLRTNTGGTSGLFSRTFMSKLLYSKLRKKENIYVLIGNRTFSSGTWAYLDIFKQGCTNIYGEPTGGTPNHFGDTQMYELPNSKLPMIQSTKYMVMTVPSDTSDAFYPKYLIKTKSQEFFAGKDPVLDAVLVKIKENSALK